LGAEEERHRAYVLVDPRAHLRGVVHRQLRVSLR